MPTLAAKQPYTRADIMHLVGGEPQTYLPQRDHIILAGCFTVNDVNPGAPLVIQVGNPSSVVRKAELLRSQPETSFPVFLKQTKSDKHYYFVGYYKYEDLKADAVLITNEEQISGKHGELAAVLYLKPA